MEQLSPSLFHQSFPISRSSTDVAALPSSPFPPYLCRHWRGSCCCHPASSPSPPYRLPLQALEGQLLELQEKAARDSQQAATHVRGGGGGTGEEGRGCV